MANIDEKIFKAYDIRGIYPDQLNDDNIVPIVRAIYKFFLDTMPDKPNPTVVLGRDMRTSSPSLFEKAQNALVEMGAQVIDVGLVSTPSFYYSVYHFGYDCGIQITASHNPKEYNGLKFVKNSPKGLIKVGKVSGMEDVKKLALEGFEFTPRQAGSVKQHMDIGDDEVKEALKILGNPEIKHFKIVADPANAMAITYLEPLFKQVPADLTKMNFELDGTFPAHPADPLDFDNLKDLQAKVREVGADFGIAPDGDGDRVFFVDEKAQVIPASFITAIISREFLKHNPGATILFDIRYTITPKKIIEENGGTSGVTKVGHAFISEKMAQTDAVFGGESSSHYFYKANGYAEWQLITILTVMKVLSEENKKLSELVEEVRRSHESGEFNFRVTNAPEILAALKEKYNDGELETLDGVSISYDNWRFNVRTSNTEPLLRLNVESVDKATMEEKNNELKAFIQSLAK